MFSFRKFKYNGGRKTSQILSTRFNYYCFIHEIRYGGKCRIQQQPYIYIEDSVFNIFFNISILFLFIYRIFYKEFPIGIPLRGIVRNCVEFKGLLFCIARIKIHLRWKPYVEFLTFNFKLKSRLVNIILQVYIYICLSVYLSITGLFIYL